MSARDIESLLAGHYPDPDANDGGTLRVPCRRIAIEESLAGREAELVGELEFAPPFAVVSDVDTHAVLGARVEQALRALGPVQPLHLGSHPHADMETARALIAETAGAGCLVAVGSGTINDLCKFAAAEQGKACAVFATAPSMNGYTSVNAAISDKGLKKSLTAVAPQGVFMDLEVLSQAPHRMIRSGLGDSVCRPTAQADWLLSHLLFGSFYRELPFILLRGEEDALFAEPEALLAGDLKAMARLARTLVLSGLGMTLCGGSYPASQGEHLISHYIEMRPPAGWPEVFHGEQIAVTSCVMARLQERMLAGGPPQLSPSQTTQEDLQAHFGKVTGAACWREFAGKRLDRAATETLNAHLAEGWEEIRGKLRAVCRPAEELRSLLARAGAPVRFSDIGLESGFAEAAIGHAREIRNRYTFLDLAADAGVLDPAKLL